MNAVHRSYFSYVRMMLFVAFNACADGESPCLNGGECIDLVRGFICSCTDNSMDPTCDDRGMYDECYHPYVRTSSARIIT